MKIATYFIPYFLFYAMVQSHPYDYDLIIIGAGASGTIAAQYASQYNKKVAIITGNQFITKHVLCSDIPLKTLISIAQASINIDKAFEIGVQIDTKTKGFNNIFDHIRQVIEKAAQLYSTKYLPDGTITLLSGNAHFVDEHRILIKDKQLSSDKFIIATGGEPFVPQIKNVEKIPYLTEDTFFHLKKLPDSIIIAGEGPLGIEMATALNRLGVKVTLLTKHGLILPKYDFELIEMQHQLMKMEGIIIHYNMRIKGLEQQGEKIKAICRDKFDKEHIYEAEKFMLALNRNGRIKHLNIDAIGIHTCRDGIIVNGKMQTSVPNIYACGNVIGQSDTLSRIGYYQAQIAAHNACKAFWQKDITADYSNISSFIYAARPLGATGLTEQAARKKYGKKLLIYRLSYESCARAQIDNTTDGIAKFICDTSGTLLGVHVLGAAADKIIDSVRIGQSFPSQFADYLLELRTSPNYLDLAWEASKRADLDIERNIFSTIMQYIRRVVPI